MFSRRFVPTIANIITKNMATHSSLNPQSQLKMIVKVFVKSSNYQIFLQPNYIPVYIYIYIYFKPQIKDIYQFWKPASMVCTNLKVGVVLSSKWVDFSSYSIGIVHYPCVTPLLVYRINFRAHWYTQRFDIMSSKSVGTTPFPVTNIIIWPDKEIL